MNLILFRPEELDRPLSGADPRAFHIRRVLRLSAGATIRVGVVNGLRGTATITREDEQGIFLEFELYEEAPKPFPLQLIVGHPRPIVIRRMLKDLTTLGIERIMFIGADLGEKSYMDTRMWEMEDWTKYLIEGAEQTRTTWLPEVVRYAGANAAIDALPTSDLNRVILDNLPGLPTVHRIDYRFHRSVVAVGPERGWSERERTSFRNAGFLPASIGNRTFRTESACSIGSALVLAGMGLLDG